MVVSYIGHTNDPKTKALVELSWLLAVKDYWFICMFKM